ncbi:glycerol kinase GlpK [Candidatus Xianfuyuplasma coldseepsis]|uniref:Glycerol kinase n=1 Tax=Candidatus Xianfuyuplasma coldseepsis TaxID=2782163 RepID=A0A7L7KTS3_9MOLU|nr:glycerol kinase GlpK [Xianfuyuplasma coldseepsis]QMS85829.1 glycerol kinase GlpK [Xianfuyuplasma coldseepsis]
MKQYVLAIDQGTTSSRCIIFNKEGQIVSQSQREVPMIYEQEDYVEQNAYDIWSTVLTTMADSMLQADIQPSEIASIGITNQRETTILWNRQTGKPIYKAIVWQSKQSNDICNALKEEGYEEIFHQKTGLLIDPYFSGTKIRWILDHVPGAKGLMANGNLCFGTVDTWLLYKLTGGQVHKTEHTNASRTLLYNIFEQQWDDELLHILDIHPNILPEVCDSSSLFGYTTAATFFGENVPITGILGDQQAALFGQLCLEKGSIKNTYGTGCFMLMNTGTKPTLSHKGLLTTIAYSMNGTVTYALEGSVFVAGSAIQWLRDALEFFDQASESEALATSVPSNYGVVVVPAFVGLGTPYWDTDAKGAMFGLTRGTSKAHITRATLESLAYQTKDVIDVMMDESGITPTFLRVDGGASANNFLMQFQSDLLHLEIIRPEINETTALGAAYMSGLQSGFFSSIKSLSSLQQTNRTFQPSMTKAERTKLYHKWIQAVQATRQFK